MSNENLEHRKSSLESIREIISSAEESIEAELSRTAGSNDWLHCFGSCVCALDLYMQAPDVKETLGPENFNAMAQQLEALKVKMTESRAAYPKDKKGLIDVPEDTQEELLTSLREIGADFL